MSGLGTSVTKNRLSSRRDDRMPCSCNLMKNSDLIFSTKQVTDAIVHTSGWLAILQSSTGATQGLRPLYGR